MANQWFGRTGAASVAIALLASAASFGCRDARTVAPGSAAVGIPAVPGEAGAAAAEGAKIGTPGGPASPSLNGHTHGVKMPLDGPAAPPTEPDEGLAVSLGALADRARAESRRGAMSPDVATLGGMTQIVGYVVDRKNHDLVLVGRVRRGAPHLNIVDLVVALKSAWMQYVIERDNVGYYTPPGVSIDPDPQTLTDLHQIQADTFRSNDHVAIQAGLERWLQVAQAPQKTRILGMPHAPLMAAALAADYEMKDVVDGRERLPGVTSLTDMRVQADSAAASGELNRFWFVSAPDPTFVASNDAVLFHSFPIALRTEQEVLKNSSTIAGSGTEDPLAHRFCEAFSRQFPVVAHRGTYAALEDAFRWIGLAGLMKHQNAFGQSGLSLDFYLRDFVPGSVDIPASLPGVASIREMRSTSGDGVRYQWLMTVGGVNLEVAIRDDNIDRRDAGAPTAVSTAATGNRPSRGAIAWRFRCRALAQIAAD